ncbi:hypothetical protein, partial [Nostoc sp. UHCC 0251]|uniref:hypothetical protein n=1 Tax=Nostoc sp. UHCC 0251 TaxID=3110240 RepID=UPI002B20C988
NFWSGYDSKFRHPGGKSTKVDLPTPPLSPVTITNLLSCCGLFLLLLFPLLSVFAEFLGFVLIGDFPIVSLDNGLFSSVLLVLISGKVLFIFWLFCSMCKVVIFFDSF